MKSTILFLFIALLFTSCASPRPWTKQEKVAAGFFLLAHSADAITTSQLTDHGNYETNPILGKHPSDTKVGVYFSLTAIGALVVSHFNPDFRKPLLYSYGALNTGLAIHNYTINKK